MPPTILTDDFLWQDIQVSEVIMHEREGYKKAAEYERGQWNRVRDYPSPSNMS